MIDYEKLKEAHQLIDKLPGYQIRCYFGDIGDDYQFSLFKEWVLQKNYKTIYEVINAIKELIKPAHKYEIGQEVWHLNDEEISSFIIAYALHDKTYDSWIYSNNEIDNDRFWLESQLYPSRESLIDSQIEYWESLKEPRNPDQMTPEFEGEVKGFREIKEAPKNGKIPRIKIQEAIGTLGTIRAFNSQCCEHDRDALKDFEEMILNKEIAGNKYYSCLKTNEIYCQCGCPADVPHRCKCFKCREYC